MSQQLLNEAHILQLPVELILCILEYCSVRSLGRLAQSCKFFQDLLATDEIWLRRAKRFGGFLFQSVNPIFTRRNWLSGGAKEKTRLEQNWNQGVAQYHVLRAGKIKFMPYLAQTKCGRLWMSLGRKLTMLNIKDSIGNGRKGSKVFMVDGPRADITQFCIDGDLLLAASVDGSVRGWSESTGSSLFVRSFAHADEVQAIDCLNSFVVSGSKTRMIKFWKVDRLRLQAKAAVNVGDVVLCCKISPSSELCAVGLTGHAVTDHLTFIDISTAEKLNLLRSDTMHISIPCHRGIRDVAWHSEHLLYAAGYDPILRLIDIRTGRCVRQWEDPYSSYIYSLDTDRGNLVVAGYAENSIVRIFDCRTAVPVKEMYVTRLRSPIYSVSFDTCAIYAALDVALMMVDFNHCVKHYRVNADTATLHCVNSSFVKEERLPRNLRRGFR